MDQALLANFHPYRRYPCFSHTLSLKSGRTLDDLPASLSRKLRYLSIRGGAHWDSEKNPIAGFPSLHYLQVFGFEPFDCAWLAGCDDLRSLRLYSALTNVDELTSLGELRHLFLFHKTKISDISFVGKMSQLRGLELWGTQVTDLSPIAVMPELAWVEVSGPVKKLPEGVLPSLRYLKVLGTDISDETAASFQERNPLCTVNRRWDEALADALAGTTKIRVCMVGNGRYGLGANVHFEETDPNEISGVIAGISVIEGRGASICQCSGSLTFEFHSEDRLIESATYHHGTRLRWRGWSGDGRLTDGSAALLRRWLLRNGVTVP